MKIGLTEDDARAASREYMKQNREVWKSLGFRQISANVHNEDRELVLAELEVRRTQRLAMIAEDDKTPPATLHTISLRNTGDLPDKVARTKVIEEAAVSTARGEILHFMEQAQHYMKKWSSVNSNYSEELPYEKKVRMQAKGVAYSNLSGAYYRLSVKRLAHAERASIFGLRGEDTPLLGD